MEQDIGLDISMSYVWILRETDKGTEVLLQKRSANKDSYPGLYDTSSAGHVIAGDAPIVSAIRELHEELGINATIGNLNYIGSIHWSHVSGLDKYEEIYK